MRRVSGSGITLGLGLLLALGLQAATARETHTVVLIVSDGLRWQEVFTGAEAALLNEKAGGSWLGEKELRARWWREDPQQRRALLFPFLWGTVAKQGQIFGNRQLGSIARVTNGKAFSYPGYNEMSVGFPNDAIDSNEFGPNPNKTVFEWLNEKPAYTGHVAIYGGWVAHERIFNIPRSHLVNQIGWSLPRKTGDASHDALLAKLFGSFTRHDDEDLYDALLQPVLLDYVRTGAPRVLFVGYGETDNWAHQGRYDLVLEAAHGADARIAELWSTMQSMPEYKGHTTFIITADHGRGSGPVQWKDHGVAQKGSEYIWVAVIGPDTPALGERAHVAPVTQSQIAATVAAFLGEDYRHDVPKAAPPIADVLPKP